MSNQLFPTICSTNEHTGLQVQSPVRRSGEQGAVTMTQAGAIHASR